MKRKRLGIIFAASFIGAVLGFSASAYPVDQEDKTGDFCGDVERGLEGSIDEGFVNCFRPESINFRLREGLQGKADTECICRKKVDGAVRQVNIAKSE